MKLSLLALALAAIAPLSAQAAGTQYNYLEGGYASTHFAGFDFNGWNLDGSVAFNDHWYGTASYTNGNKSNVDLSESTLGLGYRHILSDKSDFIAEANFVGDNADFFDNESGYRVERHPAGGLHTPGSRGPHAGFLPPQLYRGSVFKFRHLSLA